VCFCTPGPLPPCYSWRDWPTLGTGVATIPAAALGFLLNNFFRSLFGSPLVAAIFLVVNGVLLLVGKRLRRAGHRPLAGLTVAGALFIGICQRAALISGILAAALLRRLF